MGTLSRIGLADLVEAHGIDTLVETGTGHGHSLLAALQVPALRDIRSIEIDHETWHRAVVVFQTEPRVKLYHGDSPAVLRHIIADLPRNARVLWFLDAHYPGSGRLEPLPMVAADPVAAVPIFAEVSAIMELRNVGRDVIVVDDLCLFEPGDYQSDAPDLRRALGFPASLGWLELAVSATHEVSRVLRDGGYLIAQPRRYMPGPDETLSRGPS